MLHVKYPQLTFLPYFNPYLLQLQSAITAYITAKDKHASTQTIENILQSLETNSQQLLGSIYNMVSPADANNCAQDILQFHHLLQQNFPNVLAKVQEEQQLQQKSQQEYSTYFNKSNEIKSYVAHSLNVLSYIRWNLNNISPMTEDVASILCHTNLGLEIISKNFRLIEQETRTTAYLTDGKVKAKVDAALGEITAYVNNIAHLMVNNQLNIDPTELIRISKYFNSLYQDPALHLEPNASIIYFTTLEDVAKIYANISYIDNLANRIHDIVIAKGDNYTQDNYTDILAIINNDTSRLIQIIHELYTLPQNRAEKLQALEQLTNDLNNSYREALSLIQSKPGEENYIGADAESMEAAINEFEQLRLSLPGIDLPKANSYGLLKPIDEFAEASAALQNNANLTKYTSKNGSKFIFIPDPNNPSNKIPVAFVMTLGTGSRAKTEKYVDATGKTVAVKKSLNDPTDLDKDQHMLSKHASTTNPSQPQLIASFSHVKKDGSTRKVLVMEEIPGMEMYSALLIPGSLSYLSDEFKYDLALKLISALQNLHNEGIIQCDFKGDNIMFYLDSNGELRVNLVDLGEAREFNLAEGSTIGVEYYPPSTPSNYPQIAPELCHRLPIYSPKADVYSLGSLLKNNLQLPDAITDTLLKANLNERSTLDEARANILKYMQANNIKKTITPAEKEKIKYLTSVNFICSKIKTCLDNIDEANQVYATLNTLNSDQKTIYSQLSNSAAKLTNMIKTIDANLNIAMTSSDDALKQQAHNIILNQLQLAAIEINTLNAQIIKYNNMLKQNNLIASTTEPKFNKIIKNFGTFNVILEEHFKEVIQAISYENLAKKSNSQELLLSYSKFKNTPTQHVTQKSDLDQTPQSNSPNNKSDERKPK